MSLPTRYSPMASYFRLSIIFLTPQILWHAPHWCDLLWPSHDHHWLYPIPIAPLAWYHIRDLPYDLQTMLLYFPFLVSFLLPDAPYHSLTPHWWVYPSDTLLWPPIFNFLSFSLHRRSSNMHHTNMTFHDLHAITINYTLYPLHHWPGTTSETSHMTYGPCCSISLS